MTSLALEFKHGFRRHPAGVSIIVGDHPDGPVGFTASSVASVSAEPPILSFSCARSSGTAASLVESRRLTVFTLAAEQVEAAVRFADPTARSFDPALGWSVTEDGTPWLAGAAVTFRGTVSRVIPAGASWLVLVAVDQVVPGEARRPLVYADRTYWSPAPLADAVSVQGRRRVSAHATPPRP